MVIGVCGGEMFLNYFYLLVCLLVSSEKIYYLCNGNIKMVIYNEISLSRYRALTCVAVT